MNINIKVTLRTLNCYLNENDVLQFRDIAVPRETLNSQFLHQSESLLAGPFPAHVLSRFRY